MKRPRVEEVDFIWKKPKVPIPLGELAEKFGGLLDRSEPVELVYKGLEFLASQCGKSNLDKKNVPLIGLSAPSESGKTEFLKWICNNCCDFIAGDTETSSNAALRRINAKLPEGQAPLSRLLILFASFNQTSTYVKGEGPIVATTVERLLRSYNGDLIMRNGASSYASRRYKGFSSFDDIMDPFLRNDPQTGFIFCIDEFSELKQKDADEYRTLMDSLLTTSQGCLQKGKFLAIIGSSLNIYDFGNVVVKGSGRSLIPVRFRKNYPEMTKRAIEHIEQNTDVFNCAESGKAEEKFWQDVCLKVLQASSSVLSWERIMSLDKTTTRLKADFFDYCIPKNLQPDYVFEVAARTALGIKEKDHLSEEIVESFVNVLQGDAEVTPSGPGIDFSTRDGPTKIQTWSSVSGSLTLPAWRLLQFSCGNQQLFSYVQNWVLVEVRKLFYTYGYTAETQKTWEISTLAVLELRKALLQAVTNNSPPTLGKIVEELGVHHNVSNNLLSTQATSRAACNSYRELPHATTKVSEPEIIHSANNNELGVEGLFRAGFGTVTLFFQMKLYGISTPEEIKTWLEDAHKRVTSLGYKQETCVVQLFVTGAIEGNVEKYISEWPENSMVFATKALENLFKPFGSGLISSIIEARK